MLHIISYMVVYYQEFEEKDKFKQFELMLHTFKVTLIE